MITVIDLNLGNVASVAKALNYLQVDYQITADLDMIKTAEKIIFPGVGNFSEAVKRLVASGIDVVLKQKVMIEKIPILGICLGMQLLASFGEEGGGAKGLNFIQAQVIHHRAGLANLRLPHIGWNDVKYQDFKIFDLVPNESCFYFVHSYEFIPQEENLKIATSHYGVDFVAAVQKDNIIGMQFHPEKSQQMGLNLLKNFCEDRF